MLTSPGQGGLGKNSDTAILCRIWSYSTSCLACSGRSCDKSGLPACMYAELHAVYGCLVGLY
jgi:hypothetical protein